jgi:hypothetical protein
LALEMSKRPLILVLALAALVAGCGSSSSSSSSASSKPPTSSTSTPTSTGASTTSTTQQLSFENVPIEQGPPIAPAITTKTGPVDGIMCGPTEQLAYHIHAHQAVYVGGQSRSLPGGIGIPGSQVVRTSQGPVAEGGQCIYWLHTHAPDGVIHIESPTRRIYTLGEFFDEWHQPLSPTQIGTIHGTSTWIVDGKPWTKNPRSIPLLPHTVIQANVGQPPASFMSVDWSQTGL